MIDERQEELASLYVLDALEGEERLRFETQLAGDAELQRLVIELREASTVLAQSMPVTPPAELRGRVLQGIDRADVPKIASGPAPNAKLALFRTLVPWGIAAGFALIALWFAQRVATAEGEAGVQRSEAQLADLGLRAARSLLESERIVTQRQVQDLTVQLTKRQNDLAETLRVTTDVTQKLADEISASRDKDAELAELNRRLLAADRELAALSQRPGVENEVANLKIATLVSKLNTSAEAIAVAVWNPATQHGVFSVEKMPELAADQSYELWVIEGKADAKPVSAGVFALASDGTGRVPFRPVAPVTAVAQFAVSRERKDGANSHAQPSEVVMISR